MMDSTLPRNSRRNCGEVRSGVMSVSSPAPSFAARPLTALSLTARSLTASRPAASASVNSGCSRAQADSAIRCRKERRCSAAATAGTRSVSGNGSSASSSAAAAAVAAHSASMVGSSARVFAVRWTTRCRASVPGCSVTNPRSAICATVWLTAEWVTARALARSRIGTGPSATRARTTGLNRGR